LTPAGWVPANPYYLWRAIQDPEFDDVDEAPDSLFHAKPETPFRVAENRRRSGDKF